VSGKNINHSISVKSKPGAISKFVSWVLSKLKSNKFTQDDIFAVHLAIEEAFLNAIKHGNKLDPNKEVKVDCSVNDDKVIIAISDDGSGFNPDSVPDPRYGENLYKIEGRGLFLIRSYMHKVDFNKSGNRIRMIRYKGRASNADFQSQTQT